MRVFSYLSIYLSIYLLKVVTEIIDSALTIIVKMFVFK